LLPHAATLLPPLFALKQGISENLWQCGSKLRNIHIQDGKLHAADALDAEYVQTNVFRDLSRLKMQNSYQTRISR